MVAASFLNVDLDIHASVPLDELIAAFGKAIMPLYVGREGRRYAAHIELASSGYGQSADRIVMGLVRRIRKLPPQQRAVWDAAKARQFNVGIEAHAGSRPYELALKAATIRAIADVGGEIVITVYATRTAARRSDPAARPSVPGTPRKSRRSPRPPRSS